MPLRPPRNPPTTQQAWDQWARDVVITPDDGSVGSPQITDKSITNAKLRDSAATSVIGRATNAGGSPADISADADGEVLARQSGSLAFVQASSVFINSDALIAARMFAPRFPVPLHDEGQAILASRIYRQR